MRKLMKQLADQLKNSDDEIKRLRRQRNIYKRLLIKKGQIGYFTTAEEVEDYVGGTNQ